MSKTVNKWTNLTVVREAPSGTIDGVNSTYTLSKAPIATSEDVYLNGIYQRPVIDYTVIGSSLLFVIAPQTDSDIFITFL